MSVSLSSGNTERTLAAILRSSLERIQAVARAGGQWLIKLLAVAELWLERATFCFEGPVAGGTGQRPFAESLDVIPVIFEAMGMRSSGDAPCPPRFPATSLPVVMINEGERLSISGARSDPPPNSVGHVGGPSSEWRPHSSKPDSTAPPLSRVYFPASQRPGQHRRHDAGISANVDPDQSDPRR